MSGDIDQIARTIRNMREDTSHFRDEFNSLSDDELNAEIEQQSAIAEAAEFRAEAARTELDLRTIRRALTEAAKEAGS